MKSMAKQETENRQQAAMSEEELSALVEKRVQEELAKRQAEAAAAAKMEVPENVIDPWEVKRDVFLPYVTKGEEQFVYVSVNGRKYQVPRGKAVSVPLPLYERIQIMLEAQANEVKFRDSLPNEAFPS